MSHEKTIEERRIELEEHTQKKEEEFRNRALKVEERKPNNLGIWLSNTFSPAFMTAILAVLLAYMTGLWQTKSAANLQNKNFEATLITQSIAGRSKDDAIVSLKFIAKAGFIPAFREKILTLAEENKGAAIPASLAPPLIYHVAPTTAEQYDPEADPTIRQQYENFREMWKVDHDSGSQIPDFRTWQYSYGRGGLPGSTALRQYYSSPEVMRHRAAAAAAVKP